ncbi:hypothetical protein [Propionicicella superfundia]|uniref:hypothetical protein n=1 Tax=Propionicicella superfundia TaxID=348582 RepID=UPI000491454F|nr:hypothetical protein [Propionicicella superfundia]
MCGGAIERSRGGWDVDGSWLVDTTRTALKNGAAVDEQLFTRKAMGRQVCYRGRLTVRGADEDELAAELAWLQQRFDISIGGQRSTLGRCGWSLEPAVAPPLPEGNTIVFRLRSPAILIGAFGQPTFDLKGYLGARAGAGDVGATWTRPEQVSGWHGVAGVPKPLEWALATGSTALLSGWARSSLQEVRQGVGLRQREGFGEVELFAVGDLRTWDLASESGEKPGGQKHRSQDRSIASVAPARVSSEAHADPVEELSGLLPAELRVKTLKALRGACRQLMLTVDNGLPAATCIADALNQPWARDLGPDSRNLVARTLKDPDIGDHVARLDTLIGEPG